MTSGRDTMMDRWNDEKIEQLSHSIDDFFVAQSIKHEMGANAINGVFMARLLRMNEEVGNMENLYKLLESIISREHEKVDQQPIH